jgi:hypothetical protein
VPQVTVIIAAYNWSSVLRYAVGSVLWQTFEDFELWVIGDACTDDSEQVVRAFRDPRVHWLNLEVNSGSQAGPNNAGAARARGEFIAFLGQDDLWHPDHLETLVAAARRTGADSVFALAEVICPDGERGISGLTPSGSLGPDDFAVTPSLLHRKEVFAAIGPWSSPLDSSLPIDAEWQQRLWAAGKTFSGSGRLTVFKFPSTRRPNSYLERPCHEQAESTRRLREEHNFLERELIEVARASLTRPLTRFRVSDLPSVPPGFIHRWNRQVRGLEAGAASMLPLEADARIELAGVRAPATAVRGGRFNVDVELSNRTAAVLRMAPPNPIQLSYHWLAAGGEMLLFEGLRTPLIEPLAPGEKRRCSLRVEAPAEPGRFLLRVAAVQELVRWHDGRDVAGEAWIEVGVPASP